MLFFSLPVRTGVSFWIDSFITAPASFSALFSIFLPSLPSLCTALMISSKPSNSILASCNHLLGFDFNETVLVFDVVDGGDVVLFTLEKDPHGRINAR